MEHFIACVKKYPCLWNTTAIEYRDQELKDAAWAEVMKETELGSVKEVKLKWKKLRDSYRDALKRQSDMQARDPNNQAKKSYAWKYMRPMQFLQPHMSARKKLAEPELPRQPSRPPSRSASRSSDASDSDEEPTTAKRPRYEQQNGHANPPPLVPTAAPLDLLYREHASRQLAEAYAVPRRDSPDPLDVFFNSMCQTTKRLPYATQIKIKKVLFSTVIEAEEKLLADQANYASLWAREASTSGSDGADQDNEDERKPS